MRHISKCLKAAEFWIGISDIIKEDRWMDLQVIQVKGFHPSQPNDHTSANCVTLWKQFHGYWDNEDCSHHYRLICERTEE